MERSQIIDEGVAPEHGLAVRAKRGDQARTPSGQSVSQDQIGLALHQLSLGLDRVRARLAAELDLVPIDVNALVELHRRPGIRPGDLARTLNLKAAGTTSATDRLVNNGYARRSADATDRRGTRLDLTPAGAHAADWILEHLAATVTSGALDGEALDTGTVHSHTLGAPAPDPGSEPARTGGGAVGSSGSMLIELAERMRRGAEHAA